ncbi:MAG: cobalamin B12-binding domain-containing protein [Streptosporangiales bacterium]
MTGADDARIRVVLAKVGLDGHDVGIRNVAKYLTEAGVEVIYLGKRNAPEGIARTAVAEDADAIGVSCLSGGLADFSVELVELIDGFDEPIPVVAGGIEEEDEVNRMLGRGVRSYFGPGTPMDDIVKAIKDIATQP